MEYAVDQEWPVFPGSADYYRERAREMLKKARKSHTRAARAQYVALAQHWDRVAKFISHAAH